MTVKEGSAWELLDEYADIRDELKENLQSFQILHSEMSCTINDLSDEIEELEEHLTKCSRRLIRFKGPGSLKCEDTNVRNVREELPFNCET